MFYYIQKNGYAIHDCNLSEEAENSIYYLSTKEMEEIVNTIIMENKAANKTKEEEKKSIIMEGDKINALGFEFTVKNILFQDYYGKKENVPENSDCFGFDVEFTDTKGIYHHWKQNQDGGNVKRWDGTKFSIFG